MRAKSVSILTSDMLHLTLFTLAVPTNMGEGFTVCFEGRPCGCARPLQVGEPIMAGPAVASEAVTQWTDAAGNDLPCGGTYTPGETLSLSLGVDGLRAYEVSGGATITSSDAVCGGTRGTSEVVEVAAPMDGGVISAKAGHTEFFGLVQGS
ncbi:hypothetical protein KFE25_008652 [Diacronema lutheri]|uniref:Uncharacterized protein n=1 Tax=Diacronema lutheri TaxID=2081491 RepID=A0A8J5XJB7_DIALT|nr:hypothetical protein KFE25_008652 [Diacronema lutheri]